MVPYQGQLISAVQIIHLEVVTARSSLVGWPCGWTQCMASNPVTMATRYIYIYYVILSTWFARVSHVVDALWGHRYLHSCAHSEWPTHILHQISVQTQWHWGPLDGYEHQIKISNLWKVWIFLFIQCIFILPNVLFGKRLGGRFIMVGTFGNSASTFLTDSSFSKGSVNWLRTGNWMRGCDSPWWLFKSHLWLPDLGFPVTLIKQYSSGVPNYYILY